MLITLLASTCAGVHGEVAESYPLARDGAMVLTRVGAMVLARVGAMGLTRVGAMGSDAGRCDGF